MKAIEIKARKHFKNVKLGAFKATYSPSFAPEEAALVWVGDVPMPLEDYYKSLAARDREEARNLIKAPKSLVPTHTKQKEADATSTTKYLKSETPQTSEDSDTENRENRWRE